MYATTRYTDQRQFLAKLRFQCKVFVFKISYYNLCGVTFIKLKYIFRCSVIKCDCFFFLSTFYVWNDLFSKRIEVVYLHMDHNQLRTNYAIVHKFFYCTTTYNQWKSYHTIGNYLVCFIELYEKQTAYRWHAY